MSTVLRNAPEDAVATLTEPPSEDGAMAPELCEADADVEAAADAEFVLVVTGIPIDVVDGLAV